MSPRQSRSRTSRSQATGDGPGSTAAGQQSPEQWSRLNAAVTPTGSMDLLGSIPTETGAMPALGPDGRPVPQTKGAPERGSAGPWEHNPEPAGSRRATPQADGDTVETSAESGTVLRILTRFLVGLAVPLGLLVMAVRLVASPVFLWIEYNRPGFPEDPYGFTSAQRMSLGSHGVDYILNWAPSSFLGDVRTANGLAWFRPEEISHMTDVKYVMQFGLAAAVVVVLLAVVAVVLRRRHDAAGMIRAAVRGAWVSIAALVVLAVVGILSWEWFFTTFHSLFFADGTWTFSLSDTLIRLYPTQFWIDAAATVALVTMAGCAVVILWGRRALRRRSV